MDTNIAYIPGRPREQPVLLHRYLPPLPEDIASSWLPSNLPQGSWLIDPFGVSPQLALEAARTGYRILVIAKNPIIQFLLEFYADPPNKSELQTALATLATTRIGANRLEPFIINQYITECNQCGQEIYAEAFIWERETSAPFARLYRCPHCKDSGEHYVTGDDTNRANKFSSGGIYQVRAIERIISSSDQDRARVEEAINSYLPRSLHILITLINKLEGFSESKTSNHHIHSTLQRNLAGLFLHALDKSNTLWTYPTVRERPRKLAVPPRFLEHNIWRALEEAISLISSTEEPIPLTYWPNMPPESGGLAIFTGSLKELKELINSTPSIGINFDGVMTTFPRPNQAFWTLSVLWAGWLWGKESIQQYKHVLRRRRYDWSWHSNALYHVLRDLTNLVPSTAPCLACISEVEPGFLTSALVGTTTAGFNIHEINLRADQELAQLIFTPTNSINEDDKQISPSQVDTKKIEESSLEYIYKRGEPVEYIQLYAAGLTPLIKSHAGTHGTTNISAADKYSLYQDTLENAFSFSGVYQRYSSSEKRLSVGQWWVSDTNLEFIHQTPFVDRVERYIVRYLQDYTFCTLPVLDKAVCETFQGLYTPDYNLVKECLESYTETDSIKSGYPKIRTQDRPEVRHMGIMAMRSSLAILGVTLGFSSDDEQPLIWRELNGELAFVFYILSTAAFGNIIFSNPFPAPQSFIVMPGGRSRLIQYKLKHNARLRKEVETGWRFLKFRHIRRLVDAPIINRDNLIEQLEIDPLSEDDPQLRLL